MDLSKLFASTLEDKTNEMFLKHKSFIDQSSPCSKEKALKHHIDMLRAEKQNLFSQKNNPQDENFYIETFANNFYQPQQGLYSSLEIEYGIAKKQLLESFANHSFLPKIKIFLKQNDEEIIRKLAQYYAYNNALEKIQALLSQNNNEKPKNKKGEMPFPYGIDIGNINETYKALYRKPEHLLMVSDLIDELFYKDGTWKGNKGKKQEVSALIHVLKKLKFITHKSENYAIRVFCVKYNIDISYKSMRTKGYAYTDACEYFKEYFLKHFKKSSLIDSE